VENFFGGEVAKNLLDELRLWLHAYLLRFHLYITIRQAIAVLPVILRFRFLASTTISHARSSPLRGVAYRSSERVNLTKRALQTCAWAPCPSSPFPTTAESGSYTWFSSPRMAFRQLVATDDPTLNSFPLAWRQVRLEENHDATQISIRIFDQEEQQTH
jgi:hypothetical protein